MLGTGLALLASLTLLLGACGDAGGTDVDGAAPGGEAGPRIVVAGDSIAREVSGGIAGAYAAPGAEASFFLLPAIATPNREADTAALLELDPDVVVMMVGTWEGIVVDTSEPGWQQRYREEVLLPFVGELTAAGAEVVWLGYPAVDEPAEKERHELLNAAYAQLAAETEGVSFVDAGAAVEPADGSYTSSLDVAGQGLVQLRTSDGAHLCPVGVELVVDAVAQHLVAELDLPPDEGWQQGEWRSDPDGFEEPQDCVGVF